VAERRTSLEVIAPTVEEAVSRGAAELGLPKEALEVEVLDEGGKGFLGLSERQARVRLTIASEAEREAVAVAEPEPKLEAEPTAPAEEEYQLEADDEEAELVSREIVQELIQRMGLDVNVTAKWGIKDPDARIRPLLVDVQGNDLGILIGRRGETLTALQYIARLIVAKELHRPVAVVIDVEGYRARREKQLRRLADQMADQAMEMQRTLELEPMPPNERRIIHVALRDNPAVTTQSIGEGSSRKVTIIPSE
jgi:spoIIIJ-associated protein